MGRASLSMAGRGLDSGAVRGWLGAGPMVADGGAGGRRLIPAQLPHDVLGFTGREPELAGLASLAAGQEGAAVVITAIDGVAGIGKTALAVHFAHRAAPAFPDGQLFVNLRGFDPDHPPLDPGDVLARFVRALGAGASQLPADPDELAGMYRSQLSGRRVLVVLDNAASAEQVRPLLPGTAGCLAIVTSRNRLSGLVAVDGAQRLTLDMLPPGEAVALIARSAGDERAAADPAATRRLAELCGRLPLALRITADRAAAHPHLSMADLADELTAERDRLDVLATDEQASQVRAVFSWSYRALAPASARAFRLLGLHPGQDISTAAAAALLDAPVPETRQLLRTLTGGHLLEETGRDRYQFHDLVRVYAAECAQRQRTGSAARRPPSAACSPGTCIRPMRSGASSTPTTGICPLTRRPQRAGRWPSRPTGRHGTGPRANSRTWYQPSARPRRQATTSWPGNSPSRSWSSSTCSGTWRTSSPGSAPPSPSAGSSVTAPLKPGS